jgi:serine O-acetyltransferase
VTVPNSDRRATGTAAALLSGAAVRAVEVGQNLSATLARDIAAIRQRDPAARSTIEILTCYPGLHAVWLHRAAHALWKRNIPLVPRLVSQLGRFLTGVDIHPGATLGEGLFIDHASGVVIGETAQVGENVTIYQGVTLGGTGKETGKRHPTVGNNVVIGAGAHLLGSITIGDNVKIGSGSVVVQDAPHDTTVVGNPGRPVISEGFKVGIPDIDYTHLPDPVAEAMKCLVRRVVELENEIEELRKTAADPASAHAWAPNSRPHPDRSAPATDEACDPPRLDGTPDF